MNNMIECQHIKKTFLDGKIEQHVLTDINFNVQPGETVAIMGASGSGKSTLLHLIGGLDKPSAGTINIAGKAIHTLSEKERCQWRNTTLGFVYQFHHLLPEFSLLENVAIPLLLQHQTITQAEERAKDLLAKVGLGDKLHRRIGEVSGGERQRAAIARALITQPGCVLADEPTGNLDHDNAQKILDIMLKLNQDFNTSLIIVTHDPHIAHKMQRLLLLENGMFAE
ncbi:MAG: lipoprotein-releasing ABC transporter ATP-binding protein LolD [Gammaproteobacteria bacterium]|nr:lipoprotein-releasing ABC transporter ATP-binding protein LolD [Gammaproteobacteria bacterium]